MPIYYTNPGTKPTVQVNVRRRISAQTANYTILVGESGTFFTTEGASGEVVFTLPAVSAGLWYDIYAAEAQNVVVAAPAADTMIVFNDVAADQIALNTSNEIAGGGFRFVSDGAKWFCQELNHDTVTSVIAT